MHFSPTRCKYKIVYEINQISGQEFSKKFDTYINSRVVFMRAGYSRLPEKM